MQDSAHPTPIQPWFKLWWKDWSSCRALREADHATIGELFRIVLASAEEHVPGLLPKASASSVCFRHPHSKAVELGLASGLLIDLGESIGVRSILNSGVKRAAALKNAGAQSTRLKQMHKASEAQRLRGLEAQKETMQPPPATAVVEVNPKPPKPSPKKGEHVVVVENFQRAWAYYRHCDALRDAGFDLKEDTNPAAIPSFARYLVPTKDWVAANRLWKDTGGDLPIIRRRMKNLFLSTARWAQSMPSVALLASHFSQLEQPILDFANTNGQE